MKQANGYGNFGVLRDSYNRGRREYPKEIIDFCFSRYRGGNILDVGCGTGISTRQLKERAQPTKVFGTDIDKQMLELVRGYKDDITYIEAPAESLPFNNSEFGLVTAFGAFHWFANEKALSEIKRVLVKQGVFCVVNKESDFLQTIKTMVGKLIEQDMPNIKKNYQPAPLLTLCEFKGVEERVLEVKEPYTIKEAFEYCRSMSFQNLVPKSKRGVVDEEINKYLSTLVNPGGNIEIVKEVRAVIGVRD